MAHQRGQFEATVEKNTQVCREHFRLTLRLPRFPPTHPGQFVQLACQDLNDPHFDLPQHDWQPDRFPKLQSAELVDRLATLRRPFSLAGRRDLPDSVQLDLIHRVVGVGTDWMSQLEAGDPVFLLGPLGNRFVLPETGHTALLVGGGVGIPPMIYLAEKLTGSDAVAFAGATTRDLLALTVTADADDQPVPRYNLAEFAAFAIPAIITTDDGSLGFRGYITQALEQYLDQHSAQNPTTTIYCCGPELMMKRVADIASSRNISCQIAVERAMACGMGTCQSCCIKVKKHDPAAVPMPGQNWAYRLACTDGPVFNSQDLLW